MIPFNFNDCLIDGPIHGRSDLSDLIVIYPVEEADEDFHNKNLICGYLETAEIIINSISDTGADSQHDWFALPLLNIYSNVFEFLLKLLVKKINSHRDCGICRSISHPKYKIKLNHDLPYLIKETSKILPKSGPHFFPEFEEISAFIEQAFNRHITSVSTRYHRTKKGKIAPIHQKQVSINITKFHSVAKYIANKILSYLQSGNFVLCEAGEFSKRRLQELKTSYSILEKLKEAFERYNEGIKKSNLHGEIPLEHRGFIVSASEVLKEMLIEQPFRQQLEEDIIKLNDNDVAALAMALYFATNNPETIPDLSCFRKMRRDENLSAISERLSSYEKAIREINSHINFVEKEIEKRLE